MFEKIVTMNDLQPVHLDLFDHQVSGHHLMLQYDDTTLCKSLTPREHRFYENLPHELKQFVPEYRGVIEVQIEEDSEGYITLIGRPQELCDTLMNNSRQSHDPTDTGSAASNGGDTDTVAASKTNVIRLLRNGNIEVNSKKDDVSWHDKSGINPWSLKCHKENLSKLSRVGQDMNKCKFILLENVVAQFKNPCVLDLKMGTRQHGDDASPQKKDLQVKKCAATTSKCLGMRLGGMQVYQPKTGTYITHDKYYGRSLNTEGFQQALYQFLHNGFELRSSLIEPIIQRLVKLSHIIQQQDTFRFYSSSLLILYDGAYRTADHHAGEASANSRPHTVHDDEVATGDKDKENGDCMDKTEDKLDVRMIDFSHATFDGFDDDLIHTGPHSGYLFGLDNLIRMFRALQADCSRGL
ncbi:inositol hexakisphosphate kinase 1-like [Gigantopelta aegis]|uniref:inositol hexakisphosphate kinase 1-like n=1 Tax=Gigantopelta aegis TaxID=1735272 RepID=UPI001B8897DA|nr:inositol hexakisphosphate kinase 1-like [Gigantopelta aegis]XP_041357350.1 inositol hexakisphosphate kinase 1-like [Gigantopelta aegis]